MSLHKNNEIDLLDASLRQQLKKVVAHKRPPCDGKARLLEAAQETPPNVVEISFLLSMALSDNYYDKLSIERVRRVSSFTSLAGALGVF